ncbi:hypothetical protein [Dyella sp. A6]|uniref:hypothetical protein n=1 Tax=Dyella aluminiiresistens TaxID=3069105 RepID=UPI002E796788|nr:hypothetical protein [Dyella sp. A6]
MDNALPRRIAAGGLICVLLAACSSQPVRHTPPVNPGTSGPGYAPVTGVPACDAYLASYLACHRAAGIYPSGQTQSHYLAMRRILLHEAQNPATRPYLDGRCASLSNNLRSALHGLNCSGPAPRTADAP